MKTMLTGRFNNHMYTTDITEEYNYQLSEDERTLELIELEEDKLQEKIDQYDEEGGY